MQRFRIVFGLFRALFFGARYDFFRRDFSFIWRAALSLPKALFMLAFRIDRAEPALIEQRLDTCAICPIFCKELQTCGDARDLNEPDPLGCFCHLPSKARLKKSRCWVREQGVMTGGWQEVSP